MRLRALGLGLLLLGGVACGDDTTGSGGQGGVNWTGSGAAGGSGGAVTQGGAGGAAMGGAGTGGAGGGVDDLASLLARLRADRDGTLQEESDGLGWPRPVTEGLVVVSVDPALTMVAGDFNAWTPEPLTQDQGFAYALIPITPGQSYKLTDGTAYAADPWSRGFAYDTFGEISLLPGTAAHLERFFNVGEGQTTLEPRTVRVWLPAAAPGRVLYVHDGQNLFDPNAIWGGWHLTDASPPDMMFVGIDNTAARMDEYTQIADDIGGGAIGGLGDAYAAYVEDVVRPLIAARYGEPATVGVMGSSLGGLISLHIGELYPNQYDFVASLSGTLGWGSIGPHTGETLIERYQAGGKLPFVVYLDSGGNGPCTDSDGDGIQDDDPNSADNYCETAQMRDVLAAEGWQFDMDLFHWHESGAPHNEAAWAARVFRPIDIFEAL